LRQAPLRDVEAGHDLEAGEQPLGHAHRRRRRRFQEAVDAQSRLQRSGERLDMQIRGALLYSESQQIVESAHHGRAAREIAQIVEIVRSGAALGGLRRGRRLLLPARRREGGVDLVGGRHRDFRLALQRGLDGEQRLGLHWRSDAQQQTTVVVHERKEALVFQEATREAPAREVVSREFAALDTRAGVEIRELVSEVGRRQTGEARPVDLAGHVATPRAFERLGLAHDALSGKMLEKCILRHERPPKSGRRAILSSRAASFDVVMTAARSHARLRPRFRCPSVIQACDCIATSAKAQVYW
jgi:hypothetical protein